MNATTNSLRSLYERFGYKLYRMGKFEPYDMYRENKNFLRGESIITFTNSNGVLMALKPDVTLSIIKNTKPDDGPQKLFYTENVFRMDKGTREYREIYQMGLEYIGADTGYAQSEVVSLAIESLSSISEDCSLSISHMGFISALWDMLKIENREAALQAFRRKDERACPYAAFSLPLAEAIPAMDKISETETMRAAVCELRELAEALGREAARVNVDFSVVNEMEYYNGLVFQGYINGVPRAVISGGRYDNLMRRFDKPQPALGFAVYLGEIERFLSVKREYDVDALLLYGSSPAKSVSQAVRALIKEDVSVRAEREMPKNIRARRIYRLLENGRMEVELNA